MARKILITGAGGYIGSIASYLFLQKGYEVVGIDNFSTGYREPLELLQKKFGNKKFRYHELDLQNDISTLFNKEKNIEAVVHYAASCSVNESMSNPDKYFENNLWGSLNLVNNLIKHNVKYLVFSSTAAVYGEHEYIPIDESHPTKPINVYGESKLMAEKIIGWFGRLKNLKYFILRYFNVCGASEDGLIGDSKKPSPHLVQNAVRGALGIEDFYLTYPEVETPDKSPIRDYINVNDLNEAHLKALEYMLGGGKSEVANLGTATDNSVLEIIKTVENVTEKKFKIQKTTPRIGDPAKLVASVEKAKKLLGWEPKRTIDDSINSLVLWYKKNPHGWNK